MLSLRDKFSRFWQNARTFDALTFARMEVSSTISDLTFSYLQLVKAKLKITIK